jgi:two-component system NtrC family sensor kinase
MGEQVRILCVDDEENVLRSLKRLFLDSEYEIFIATSGDEGLELLRNTEPVQIVMSDYRMPKMNGVDFLKEVYKHWPDTIRIVLSGYADTVAIIEAINIGHIYKFIPKPWNDAELKVAISNALDRYFIKQKNVQLTKELELKNRELQEINNNLEMLVTDRTADLMMRNKMLTCSQNILDSLPIAVIGIDPEGQIVQCNKLGMELFHHESGNILGTDRRDSLSEEINAFIENVFEKGKLSAPILSNGKGININGVHMKYSNGQEGIIMIFDKDRGIDNGNCE